MADQQFSAPITPEDAPIALQLRDPGGSVITEVTNFREYSFQGHFLTPTDGFSFVIGDEAVKKSILQGIYVGQQVTLSVGGYVSSGGYLDKVKIRSSRKGTEVHLDGRDWLAPAVDAEMDPAKTNFQASNTLLDVIVKCFAPYGFGEVGQILASDEANGNIITGQKRGLKTTKTGKTIKSALAHQLKPYPHEGVFAFASRMSQRFGLWIWASADGQNLIVDEPDFTQKAIYNLWNKTDDNSRNNLEEAELDVDASNQPSIIVATGYGGGGDTGRVGMKCIGINELTGVDASGAILPEVQDIVDANPTAVVLPIRSAIVGFMANARVRAIYLHDDESKTPDELQSFVRRELALKQQHGVVYRTIHERHEIAGVPLYTNSIANVDDDTNQLHDRMWCLSRTFQQSRDGGTTTHGEWILPGTLNFGD